MASRKYYQVSRASLAANVFTTARDSIFLARLRFDSYPRMTQVPTSLNCLVVECCSKWTKVGQGIYWEGPAPKVSKMASQPHV